MDHHHHHYQTNSSWLPKNNNNVKLCVCEKPKKWKIYRDIEWIPDSLWFSFWFYINHHYPRRRKRKKKTWISKFFRKNFTQKNKKIDRIKIQIFLSCCFSVDFQFNSILICCCWKSTKKNKSNKQHNRRYYHDDIIFMIEQKKL